jgi:TP901 family phage tail tape measure protein
MAGTVTNEIELRVTTPGAPEGIRAFNALRDAQGELRGDGAPAADLAGFDPTALVAATEQVSVLVAELGELRGAAVAAGAGVSQALGSASGAELEAVESAAAAARVELQGLSTEAAAASEQLELFVTVDAAPVKAVGTAAAAAGREVEQLGDAARDGSAGVEAVGREAEATGRNVQTMAERVGDAADRMERLGNDLTTRVSLPLFAVGAASTKMAVDFGDSLGKIENLVGISAETVDGWRGSLLEMGPELAAMPNGLAEGLFVVTSAGERGAEALDVLEDASMASAVGLGQTATIARTTTAAMQAYEAANLTSARATDIMLATARAGNFEVEQLAGSIGAVLPVAASMGVEFEEVGAFIASFTRVNGDAAVSVTALRSYLQTLLNPSDDAEKVLKKVGLSAAKLREEVRDKGLTQTLLDLIDKFDGNTAALARVIPNVEGLVGVLGTAGLQAETFAQVSQEVANSQGILEQAFARVRETEGFKFRQAAAEAAVLAVEIGSELAPALVTLLEAGRPVVGVVSDAVQVFGELPEPLQAALLGFTGLVMIAGPVIASVGSIVRLVVDLRAAVVLLNGASALGGTAAVAARAAAGVGGVTTAATGATAAIGTGAGLAGAAGALGTVVMVGGPLLAGLLTMSAILEDVKDNAREAAEEVVDAVSKVKAAIPQMDAGVVVAAAKDEAQRANDLYADLEEKRRAILRLHGQGAWREGAPGRALYAQLTSEYEALAIQYRAVLDLAKEFEAERTKRNTIDGLTISVEGPKRPVIDLEGDSGGRKKARETPTQVIGVGDGFARVVVDRAAVAGMIELQEQTSQRVRQLTTELALAEESLRRLPKSADGWAEMNEKVYRLRGDLRELGQDLRLLGGNLSGLKMADLSPFLAAAGLDAGAGLSIDRTGLSRERREALDQQHYGRQYQALVAMMVDPEQLRGAEREAAENIVRGSGNTWETFGRDVGKGSDELERAGVVAVQAFGSIAQAAISGSATMEQAVIQGFASIAQAAVSQANPILGAGIGVLGGIIGSLFGRRERREPQPVRVEEYSQRALDQSKRKEGPDVVNLQFVTESGEILAETGYALERLGRRDAVVRIPNGYRLVKK